MLTTEYQWMSTCECITISGLLSTCVPKFRSDLELAVLPLTKQAFCYSILRWPCFIRLTSHNTFVTLNVYFVHYIKLHYINDFIGCEITHNCMALIPMHCPFNA